MPASTNNCNIKLKWAQGFCSGSPGYVSRDRIVVPCDGILKSCSIDGQSQNSYPTPGIGIGCVTTCPELGIVAVSEQIQHPEIHVVRFPGMEVMSVLQDGASEEYVALAFAGLDYLVSVGGPKDHVITTWDWRKAECVYSLPQTWYESKVMRVELSVNPTSWYQLCLHENFCVTFLDIKNCGRDFSMVKRRFALTEAESEGAQFRELEEYVDVDATNVDPVMRKSLKPECHCWLPGNDLLMACIDGSVIRTNVCCHASTMTCRMVKNVKGIISMAFNMSGLFVAKKDGLVEVYDLRLDKWVLLVTINVGSSAKRMLFSPDYETLAIQTAKESVFVYDTTKNSEEKKQKLQLILGGEMSEVVSLCVLGADSRYCVTAKRNGLIQTWDIYDGALVSNFSLDDQAVVKMASSLLCSVIVVGTLSGFVYFIDMTDGSRPRIVNVVTYEDLPVEHICFDNFGQHLGIAAKCNSLQLFNGLPSSGFLRLGQRDFPGKIMDVKLFCVAKESPTDALVIVKDENSAYMLVKWTLPLDLLQNARNYQVNNFGTLMQGYFSPQMWSLTHQAHRLDAHSDLGAIFYSKTVEKIQKIPIWSESQVASDPIDITQDSAISFLRVSPDQSWLACLDIYGNFRMYLVDQQSVELGVELSDKCKKIRHSFFDFSMLDSTVVIAKEKGTIMCYEWKDKREIRNEIKDCIANCRIQSEKENECLRGMNKEEDDEQGIRCVAKKNSSHLLRQMDQSFGHSLDVFSFQLNNILSEYGSLHQLCPMHFTLDEDFTELEDKINKKLQSLISLIPGNLAVETSTKNAAPKNDYAVKTLSSLGLNITFSNYTLYDATLEILETLFQKCENNCSSKGLRRANSESVVSMSVSSIPNQDLLEQVRKIKRKIQDLKRDFNKKFKSLHYERAIVARSISESYIRMKTSAENLPSKAEKDFWNTMIESDMGKLNCSDLDTVGNSSMDGIDKSGEQARRTISSMSENITSVTEKYDNDLEKLYQEKLYCDFVVHKEEVRISILFMSNSFKHFMTHWKKNFELTSKCLNDYESSIFMQVSEVEHLEGEVRSLYPDVQKLERDNNHKAEAILKRNAKIKTEEKESMVKFYRQEAVVELDADCTVNPFWCHPSVVTKRCLSLNSKISETDSSPQGLYALLLKSKDAAAWKKLSQRKAQKENLNLILRFLISQALDLTGARQRCEELLQLLKSEKNRCMEIDTKMSGLSLKFDENVQMLLTSHLQDLESNLEPDQTAVTAKDTWTYKQEFRTSVRTHTFVNTVLQERLEKLEQTFEVSKRIRAEAESRRTIQNRKFLDMKHSLREDVKVIQGRFFSCKIIAEELLAEARKKSLFRFFGPNVGTYP